MNHLRANLYFYEQKNLVRFFYNIDTSAITQLIYKRYDTGDGFIRTNNRYQQQIFNYLQCGKPIPKPDKILYHPKPLVSIFTKYNECKGTDFKHYGNLKKKKFRIGLKSGISLNSVSIFSNNFNSTNKLVKHKNLPGYKFGLSIEYLLPFNNDKWAINIEPSFQMIKGNKTSDSLLFPDEKVHLNLDYKSIELSTGIKHMIYLNPKSNIFLSAFVVLDHPINSRLINNNVNLSIEPILLSYSFGAGYEHNNKYSLELRYFFNRDLLNSYLFYHTNHSGLIFMLGYRFL